MTVPFWPSGPTAERETDFTRTRFHPLSSRFSDATTSSTLGNTWLCASLDTHGGAAP
jgi:hypothetical protein